MAYDSRRSAAAWENTKHVVDKVEHGVENYLGKHDH